MGQPQDPHLQVRKQAPGQLRMSPTNLASDSQPLTICSLTVLSYSHRHP